ncbi:MAG: YdcF family protein [Planctomycetota bacterium]
MSESPTVPPHQHSTVKGVAIAIFAVGMLMAVIAGLTMFHEGWVAGRRVILACLMPIAWVWCGLWGQFVWLVSQARYRLASAILLAFAGWTLLGNTHFSAWFASKVEYQATPSESANLDRYQAIQNQPVDRPLDVIVVLGGSTQTMKGGQPELMRDGERVVSAAQIWHAGNCRHILTTGSTTKPPPADHPRDQARRILISLDVPPEAIDTIPGVNTAAEMKSLRTWIADQQDASRLGPNPQVGLITSAFHLPPALRLAKKAELAVIPIPCAFRVADAENRAAWYALVPSDGAIQDVATCLKECLARIAGQ